MLIFAAGIAFSRFLSYLMKQPTVQNVFKGNVKNKVKGHGNTQTNDNKAVIHGGMKRREVIQIWKSTQK